MSNTKPQGQAFNNIIPYLSQCKCFLLVNAVHVNDRRGRNLMKRESKFAFCDEENNKNAPKLMDDY